MRPHESIVAFLLFLSLLLASFGIFSWLMWERIALLKAVQPSDRLDRWGERWRGVATYFVAQRRILSRGYRLAGLMHALIFWGFLAVAINTIHFVGGGFSEDGTSRSSAPTLRSGRPIAPSGTSSRSRSSRRSRSPSGGASSSARSG